MKKFGCKTGGMLFAYAVSLFGSGMTEPYLILYLHDRIEFNMAVSGMIIAMTSVSGMAAIPISGWLGRFIGAKYTLIMMLVLAGGGEALMAVIHQPSGAYAAAVLLGAGNAGAWNTFSSLLAGSAGKGQRTKVFGMAFAMQNFAAGAGATAGDGCLRRFQHLASGSFLS